jgi:C1A family cysteine protease
MLPAPTRAYGWRPDRPDHRDFLLHEHVELPDAASLPARVDLRETGFLDDPIFDQGQLGSCTANAIASALQYVQRATGLWALALHVTPSRLALYFWERELEGTADEDAGAELRDGLKVVSGQPGYIDEEDWPYDIERFAEAPPANVTADAAKDHATKYMRCAVNATAMRQALAAGFPVIVGFEVYQEIESDQVARTGYLPRPARGESAVGGHAVLLVGYDDARRRWICRNSWGPDWGMGGYFETDYGYLDSSTYGGDFWVIQAEVEGDQPAPPPGPTPTDLLHELADLVRHDAQAALDWLHAHGL